MIEGAKAVEAGLGVISGLTGLFGSSAAAKEKARIKKKGQAQIDKAAGISDQMGAIASDYDPVKETQAASDRAQETTRWNLDQVLKKLNTDFANAGGLANGDTRFRDLGNQNVNRVMDPLKDFEATRLANSTGLKMQTLGLAHQMAGNTAQNYLSLADQTTVPPMTGGLHALTSGIKAITENRGIVSDNDANRPKMKSPTKQK